MADLTNWKMLYKRQRASFGIIANLSSKLKTDENGGRRKSD